MKFLEIKKRKNINGEMIKIKDIKLAEWLQPVSKRKLKIKRDYYKKHGYFREEMILNNDNILVDGYSSYVLAKELGFKNVIIKRSGGKYIRPY